MNSKVETSKALRQLTAQEIETLVKQGCCADNWELIAVGEPFAPEAYRCVEFHGVVTLAPGSRISRAVIDGCEVGQGATIKNVDGGLKNLIIGDGVTINSVFSIACNGESCFGNDVTVNVISETGGREVNIHCELSAPVAYMQAFYRHNLTLTRTLKQMAQREADSHRSSKARIAAGSEVCNCGELLNVEVLGKSKVVGASRLVNGTIRNAFVGAGVIAEDFICLDGAKVDAAARLHGVFVGQCASVCNGFTAHDSLVFANANLENGESAAAFIGPFATSMHKSTLLIGGLFSFFNAGSATNQSNHLYKLGPMHQGVLGRGAKTGSSSYLLWPAAIAPFTVVNGKHYGHPDTRDFPFSYLINNKEGDSLLIPAASLASVGLARDVSKWPARDKRLHGSFPLLDPLNFNWLSPYTLLPVLRALSRLRSETAPAQAPSAEAPLSFNKSSCGEAQEAELRSPSSTTVAEAEAEAKMAPSGALVEGFVIPATAVQKAITRYQLVLDLFLGGIFRRRILNLVATAPEITAPQLLSRLRGESPSAQAPSPEPWADLAGLLAPRGEIARLIAELTTAAEPTFAALNEALSALNKRYGALSWTWVAANLPLLTAAGSSASGITLAELTLPQLCGILRRSAEAAASLEQLFVADAAKEFDPARAATGFGIDAATPQERLDDFAHARGSLQGEPFLAKLHNQVAAYRASLEAICLMLSSPAE
jgi:hypothetical protein